MSTLSIGDSNWHSALNQSTPTGEAYFASVERAFLTIMACKHSAPIKMISKGKAILILSFRSCSQYCGRRDHSNRHSAPF
jgi:hypothetical protein